MPDKKDKDPKTIKIKTVIEIEKQTPNSLFLREAWLSGKTEDGKKFEMTRNFGGQSILFQIDKIFYSISVKSLVDAFLDVHKK